MLPVFEKGSLYQSLTHGMVEYLGTDTYYGQNTLKFKSIQYNTTEYWLPESLSFHFGDTDSPQLLNE